MRSEIYKYIELSQQPDSAIQQIIAHYQLDAPATERLLKLVELADISCLEEALMLLAIGADWVTFSAALLVDQQSSAEHLVQPETLKLIKHQAVFAELAKLRSADNAESLRRLLLVMVEDPRSVLLTLVRQIRFLRLAIVEASETAESLALITRRLYAPLAGRLGVAQLKWELEDLAFRILDNEAYKDLAKRLEERRVDREAYVENFIDTLSKCLTDSGISDFEISGRVKHLYSIYNKMRNKRLRYEELFDIRAVRVLLPKASDCYATLGLLHGQFSPVPGQFDDYIGQPKPNGYQSLHTVVLGPGGKPIEVQMRSFDMHREAELGVAAHWQYKEGGQDSSANRVVQRLRALLEHGELGQALEGDDLFSERVFALTPNGDVVDLAKGATPLDFAYAIHTSIGHRCRGAKVNGEIVPLSYGLKNAQTVEVLTSKEERPSRDWLMADLGYLQTQRARTKVRHYFNQLDHAEHLRQGREIVERLVRRHNFDDFDINKLVAKFRISGAEDLYVQIGRGEINSAQVTAALEGLLNPAPVLALKRHPSAPRSYDAISVQGVGQMKTSLASCCQPVPAEPIIGLITKSSGVSVHRRDCVNMLNLPQSEENRLIEVSWGEELERNYPVRIVLQAYQRDGLLRDIGQILANRKVALIDMQSSTDPVDGVKHLRFDIELASVGVLGSLLHQVQSLPNVISARRAR